ncbi:MAG: hypothetical protein KUL85_16740 [Sphingobacterium mizutaii]|nr:hypothetical protein [Sphingobacterium mizutaii]
MDNVWDGVAAFGIGAAGGAVVAATGGAVLTATGLTASRVLGGAVSGVTGFATGGVLQNVGNHLYFGDPLMSGKEFALGLATSAFTGGVFGGVSNKIWGRGTNFWTGKDARINVGYPKYEGYTDDAGNLIKEKPSVLPDYPGETAKTATQRARELGQQGERSRTFWTENVDSNQWENKDTRQPYNKGTN